MELLNKIKNFIIKTIRKYKIWEEERKKAKEERLKLIKEKKQEEERKHQEYLRMVYLKATNPGAYGEELVFKILIDNNIKGYKIILRNLYIPYNKRTSEIDILLIHETGIYVIESKNYSGWIFGSAEQQQWTQMLNKNTKNRFYNPIKQNTTHITALSQFLHINKSIMKSFIVFSERCELKKVPNNTAEYTIIKRNRLLEEIKKEIANRSNILTPDTIDRIFETLIPLTNVSEEVKQQHINDINKTVKKI